MAKQNKAAGRDGPAILVVGLKLILAAARCALDDSLSFLNCLISEQDYIGNQDSLDIPAIAFNVAGV